MGKKIAIVGCSPTSRHLAPFDKKDWEIWACNYNPAIPKFDKWFEFHSMKHLKTKTIDPGYYDFLKKCGKKLYVAYPDDFPHASVFPLDKLKGKFPNYFTSTIAYLLALAILEEPEQIGLWGVDMIGDGEYAHQRACCELFVGIAMGKGIKVTISESSALLTAPFLYAFEEESEEFKQLKMAVTECEHEIKRCEELEKQKEFFMGQKLAYKLMARKFYNYNIE